MKTLTPRFVESGAVLLLAAAPAVAQVNIDDWRDKVDASVPTQAASLGEAEFFIYMQDLANVSAASFDETRGELRRVISALSDQGPW